jgi:hypothetical protein
LDPFEFVTKKDIKHIPADLKKSTLFDCISKFYVHLQKLEFIQAFSTEKDFFQLFLSNRQHQLPTV